MDRATRIFLACATGAGIGTLAALQLGNFWGLGALLGGLVGYLVYDLEQVVKMIPVAWNKVSGWELDKENLVRLGIIVLFFVNLSFTIVICPLVVAATLKKGSADGLCVLMMFYGWCACLFFYSNALKNSTDDDLFYVLRMNPVTVYIYYPAKGIVWAVPRIPAGLKILANFCKQLFLLIHSDLRLLCGVDSLIGASVGYFTGNVLIGALVGGVLGVLNYEIVSKRLLKVTLRN